jgi:YidC/Oxa1 family membrane protein insertase
MERRLLLVFALIFLIIIGFQPLFKKYLPQAPTAPPQSAQTQTQPAPAAPVAATSPSTPAAAPLTGSGKQAAAEEETVIENDLYRITFSNRGAVAKSWILKKYDDEKRQPLDVVNSTAAPQYGYPLSLWLYDEGLRNRVNTALYVSSTSGKLTAPGQITFEYADGDLSIRKTFHFDDTYVIKVETAVVYKGSTISAFPMWPAGFGDELSSASYAASHIEYQYDGNTERLPFKKVSGGNTIAGPFNWAGVTDQYFAAVFIPEDSANASLLTLHHPIQVPKNLEKPDPKDLVQTSVLGAGVGKMGSANSLRLYVGPKALQVLESIPVPTIVGQPQDLRSLVNFGFFQIIARPLFIWLKWTYGYVHNWGWAIVIQTFLITLALVPLRISSMRSALKMQKVQPQMKAIQEKYKKYSMKDPRRQEMNAEIGALMKREGVNPVGGCFPMILQMPFLFAYYSMLNAALDLRHAHWLWISDLSSRDPVFILPVLLVISMFVTQRMTPQAGMDPAQQKMMNWMMPLMMGFIFFNLASGLNLYYAESNLIMIAQQAIMNRTKLGREMREAALKRNKKK